MDSDKLQYVGFDKGKDDVSTASLYVDSEITYDFEKARKLLELIPDKFESETFQALKDALVYGYSSMAIKPVDKRTDVQRKADWYVEQQKKKLG